MKAWRHWLGRVLAGLGLLLILLSFLPLWWTDRWWVRLWDYPRIQIAGLILLVGVGLFFTWSGRRGPFWALMAGLMAALAWQTSHFLAYLPFYPKQVASTQDCPAGRQITLLNANVLLTNSDYGALLNLVEARQPDVLLLLEVGNEWAKAVEPLSRLYPYRLSEAVPNTYGMILMSRLPMKGKLRHILQPGVPSADVELLLAGGQWVSFRGLHPEPPWPGDDSGERDAELVAVGREVRNDGGAAIVMGDLNDVAWSRTSRLFKDVAGLNDPRVGRGFFPTFNANYPLLRWPLDHLFVSPHFKLMGMDVLGDIGSDHFPILFRLCLKGDATVRKVPTSAPAPVEAEASEELSEGKAEHREENSAR